MKYELRNRLLLAMMTALALTTAGCASAPSKAPSGSAGESVQFGELLASGDSAARQGDLRAALLLYGQALEIEETAELWFRAGAANQQVGQIDAAAFAYGRVLELDEAHARAFEALGLIHLREGRTEQARPLLVKAIGVDAARWQAHNGLGILADLAKDSAAAISHYLAALDVHPGSAMLINNVGYSYYLAGDHEQARRYFESALSYDDYEPAILNLGLVYARQGRYALAVDTLSRAVDRAVACNDVGFVALRNGDHRQAEELLREAIRLSPVHYEIAQRNLALARAGGEGQ